MSPPTLFPLFVGLLSATWGATHAQGRPYGEVDAQSEDLVISPDTRPLVDVWMRDTYVTRGPDGWYYLTGTTAAKGRSFSVEGPHCWDWNDGVRLWRSPDLVKWEPMGLVWSLDDDATWQSEFSYRKPQRHGTGFPLDGKRRAVWAPELHYLASAKNWFLVACMNDDAPQKGSFVLRSTTGSPAGPYENIAGNADGPLFKNIDGSLFEDEDGSVWFIGHNHFFARMKPDLSGLDEAPRRFKETPYPTEPYLEGAYVLKHGGRYHLVQAAWSFRRDDGTFSYAPPAGDARSQRWSYDCIVASSDRLEGPYGERYTVGVGIGHNNLFSTVEGKWYATMFGNPRGVPDFKQPFLCRPAILPLAWSGDKFRLERGKASVASAGQAVEAR